jgi:hypothetical protein
MFRGFSSFPEKKQKRLFCFAEELGCTSLNNQTDLMMVFFFQKKKQKALFCFAETLGRPTLGEADPGGLGACPQ